MGMIVILAVTLLTVPTWANSVVNGDFQYSSGLTGYLYGWTQGSTPFTTSGNYQARSKVNSSESEMYQIVDVSKIWNTTTHALDTNQYWIAGGASETLSFSFEYTRPDHSSAEYQLYYWTGAGAPEGFNNDSPGSGWTLLADGALSQTESSVTYTFTHTFTTSQPQYFAVGLEGMSGNNEKFYTTFDNVSLTTVCTAIPIPGSVLLLGTGLVGLGLLRFRRRQNKA
jgi:hypothetical protein